MSLHLGLLKLPRGLSATLEEDLARAEAEQATSTAPTGALVQFQLRGAPTQRKAQSPIPCDLGQHVKAA